MGDDEEVVRVNCGQGQVVVLWSGLLYICGQGGVLLGSRVKFIQGHGEFW